MFKIKAQQIRPIKREGEKLEGMSGMNVGVGTFLQVLDGSTSNQGDIIIRTNEARRPFRNVTEHSKGNSNMKIGGYWGTSLIGYKFRVLEGYILDDFPEYRDLIAKE